MAKKYRYVSGDTHLELPSEHWTHRVDPKYRDWAPNTIRLDDRANATVYEDNPPVQNTLDLHGGKGRDVFGIGVLPGTGVDDCIAEMELCKKLGFTDVQLMTFPNGGGRPGSLGGAVNDERRQNCVGV